MSRRALIWIMTWVGPLLVRLWFSTIRFRWCGEGAYLNPDPRTRKNAICAFWHQRVLTFAFTHRYLGSCILVSRSRDGEMYIRMLGRLGFRTPRGSSKRGGSGALRTLLVEAESGCDIGMTVDGPRGPLHVFKVGAVYLASKSGLPILLLASSYHRYWRLKTWDRFQVPWPFTWGVVRTAAPISVPPDLDESGLEEWRQRLEQALTEHTRDTDLRLAELYREGRRRRDL